MIFYFSGTGNSLYVAKKLLKDGELLVNIADALKEEKVEYEVKKSEKIGFVFPTYFYGVPSIVLRFISKLLIHSISLDNYVYAVMTCGGSTGNALHVFKRELLSSGYVLKGMFSIKMVDNYIPLYKIAPVEKQTEELLDADNKLEEISEKVHKWESGDFDKLKGSCCHILTFLAKPVYNKCRTTKKFYVENTCIGCKKCADNCPENAISIFEGKPMWIKDKCVQCFACLHRCPVQAIQYGKASKTSGRYVNPKIKFTD